MIRLRLLALLMAVWLGSWTATARAEPAGGVSDLALGALTLVGAPYRHGGEDPAGFDCSGLVRYVARVTLGLQLPRRAEEIGRAGSSVGLAQLQPGDLVFFNTLGRPFSHVGIYLGNQQFVHAPTRRGQVRIESMAQPYWQRRFDGARRLAPAFVEVSAPPAAMPERGPVLPSRSDDLWDRITP